MRRHTARLVLPGTGDRWTSSDCVYDRLNAGRASYVLLVARCYPANRLDWPRRGFGREEGEGDWWWPLGSVFDASMRWGGGRRETRLGWYRAWEGVGLGGGGPMEDHGWEVGFTDRLLRHLMQGSFSCPSSLGSWLTGAHQGLRDSSELLVYLVPCRASRPPVSARALARSRQKSRQYIKTVLLRALNPC